MAVEDYDDITAYDHADRPSGYAPDRGPAGHGIVPPDYVLGQASARPVASFTAEARGPRVPTSALTGSVFSGAELPVDQQFAWANEHSVAMRAMGRGPAEHAGDHQILTAQGPSTPSAEELLDRVAPRWRAVASQTHQPEMPGFGGGGGRGWFGRGGAAKDSGQAAEEPEAAEADEEIPNNAAGQRA